MSEKSDNYRTQPMYTFREAADLSGVSPGTVRNWLFGYSKKEQVLSPKGRVTRSRLVDPLFNTMPPDGAMVSFLQLIEIVVAARFRTSEGVKFQTVRQAYLNAQQEFGLQYPFAHLRLKAIGGHIVRLLQGVSSRSLDTPSQWTLPDLVVDVMEQLDYERELASRWYPVGKGVPIVVDPRVSAGLPTFEGRGVTIAAIRWRWKEQHQSIDFIASDFEIPRDQVERALQYAEKVAA